MVPLSNIPYLPFEIEHRSYAPFLYRLKELYAAMDLKYREAADYYGFRCNGCEDNCCFTRFYHHTLLEYLYIRKGFYNLNAEQQTEIRHNATNVCRKTDPAENMGTPPVRLMCPLNFDGLCRLYTYRPMICRLHGISHEFHRPDQEIFHAPGCDLFTQQCQGKKHFKFDRTPFYIKMAELEMALKQAVGITNKIKTTIAQMITTFR